MSLQPLLGRQVRHETRLASDPAGSGARACSGWYVSPIVAVTATTVVIQVHSGRRISIKRATGEGRRSADVVTALHPEDAKEVAEGGR